VNPIENRPAAPMPLRLPLSRPRVTYVLLAIIGIVFVIEELSGGSQNVQVLINLGGNSGELVSKGQYWRLFTANFLHIGLLHIAFNAYALYWLGQETEALYGPVRFIAIYLLSCLSGAIASFALTYPVVSAGASTGIFGLIGTLIAFFTRNRQVFGAMGRGRLNNLLFIGAINLMYGLSNPAIDMWGHVGGFIGGLTLGWLLCPYYQIEQLPDGSRRVLDLNSLRSEWIGVLLVCVLLIVAFVAALLVHRA
jgi:rhomboid protease GluP